MDIIAIFHILAEYFLNFGYLGIFILMALESTFFPFPSEIVMIPAGYFVATGEMNFTMAVAAGIGGSIAGALFNYYLGLKVGRTLLVKYGKYFKITEEKIQKADRYFEKYGALSTFIGRLIPVVRQYISLPAGISRMNLFTFSLFTGLGAGIWVIFLTLIGVLCGQNAELIGYCISCFKGYFILPVLVCLIGYGAYKVYKIKFVKVKK